MPCARGVVTPWRTLLSAQGLIGRVKSEWVLMSMKPGVTARPSASITLEAGPARRAPIAAMRPAWIAISAGLPAAPVPLYVKSIDAGARRVVVGTKESAGCEVFRIERPNFVAGAPPTATWPGAGFAPRTPPLNIAFFTERRGTNNCLCVWKTLALRAERCATAFAAG